MAGGVRVDRGRRLASRVLIVALALGAFVAWGAGWPWLNAWWSGLAESTRRTTTVGFLVGVLVAYGVALTLALVAGSAAAARVIAGRKRREPRPVSSRVLLLCVATLFSLGMLELGAWGFASRAQLPSPPAPVPPPRPPSAKAEDFVVLVIGESSAEGHPFHSWYSIGHVVARELERAMPGRKVRLKMAATGGIALVRALEDLEAQTERPDLVLLYSGHNEFQARWGWTHVVNYYDDDVVTRPRDDLTDRVGDITPFTRMLREAVDRQRISTPPLPREVRDVVERPVCVPKTRAEIADLFATHLERIATWCDRAGAVPLFFLPAGNDVGFDPDRSLLSPGTRLADREAFATEFLAARALDATDPEAAIASYRRLIALQPGFAESHYRLAQHLQAKGLIDQAKEEYVLARDLDGLPLRCPSEFQDAYRAVASRHPRVILVDAPSRLEAISPTGLLDDNVFHDPHHPSFLAYLALARGALEQLRGRGHFGLERADPPRLDPAEVASYFGFDVEKWDLVCRRSASFWKAIAVPRYDGSERLGRGKRFLKAAAAIRDGTAPDAAGVPGLGIQPPGFR